VSDALEHRIRIVTMIRQLSNYIKKGLFQLIFFVTNRCNSKCSFCFNWKNLNRVDNEELTLEHIGAISKTMPRFPWLMISGGEPFLREDLSDIVALFHKNNRIAHLTIPTNGILTEKIIETLTSVLTTCTGVSLTLAVSLDNWGEKHDDLRGVRGNFEKALMTIKDAKTLGLKFRNFSVKVNTVLSTYNHEDLAYLIEHVKDLGISMHSIDFIRGDLRDNRAKLPPLSELPHLIEKIKDVCRFYGGYESLNVHAGFFKALSMSALLRNYDVFFEEVKGNRQVIPCYAGKVNAVLYSEGNVGFCEMLECVGNMKDFDFDFKRLWRSEKAREMRRFIAETKCHCYHPCYVLTNLLFNGKELMKLLKVARWR
jgi:MoaA/NifB/PqqE/SkfB family radical SAM enzyme